MILKLKFQYFGPTSCEELTHWKRLWCWQGLGAGGEGDDRRWDGWMASPTQCTWVWVNSGSWWWIGRPGVLQFMGSQRVRRDWATELNWTLGFFISTFSSWFRCEGRLFTRCFSYFLWYACIAMNFPLSTAFIVFHRFWVVVFSFSYVSMHILISSMICWLFRSMLFSLRMFVFLIFFPCNWHLILPHCD